MVTELAPILAIGGPTGAIGAAVAILIKSYFDARKDKREQQASDVQTESGIVDNAKKVIELVRGETDRMEQQIVALLARAEAAEDKARQLESDINKQDDTIARQARKMEWLEEDLIRARQEIEQLREAGR